MKVFFSYGHDDNAPLVARLKCDLEKTKVHTVWLDAHEIAPNDDWRRRIVEGLQDTGWTFAFLSPHAVRAGSVCRDEVAITLGETGWALTPVLVEKIADADFPVLPGHIQMLDLSDWREQGEIGSARFEAWYAPKLAELAAILADDRNARYAAEMARIAHRLAPPAPQHAEIARLTGGFVGRAWLLAEVEAWRRDPLRQHLLWLTADPGMGKSAFSAWLARTHRANVVALRLCSYASEDRRDPARVVRALAFQLARRLADYRARLLKTLPARPEDLPANVHELIALLLRNPLGPAGAIDGGRAADPFLVVVDGLDETVESGASALTRLLVDLAPDLPRWLSLMVTSRPDSPVREMLDAAKKLRLEDHAAANDADLALYARAWLAGLPAPPADPDTAIRRVVAAAQGSMTYLRALQAMNADDPVALEGLPAGLGALFYKWLERQFPTEADYRHARALIDVLAAARLPVPEAVLAEAAGLTPFETAARLRALGSLFGPRNGGIAPFHLSLRDWLGKDDAGRFAADTAAGRARLLAVLWPRLFAAEAADDAYLLGDLPDLAARHDLAALRLLIAENGGWRRTDGAVDGIGAALARRYAWRQLLTWHDLHARAADACGDDAADGRVIAIARRGDVLRTLGDVAGTLAAYHDAMATAVRFAVADPGNAGWQRDLVASTTKLAIAAVKTGDLATARVEVARAVEQAQSLVRRFPHVPQFGKDLQMIEQVRQKIEAEAGGRG